MKNILKRLFSLALLLCVLSFAFSCSKKEEEAKRAEFGEMSLEELCRYAELGGYKDMSISLSGRSKDEAVWDAIREEANIKEYPEEQVGYYLGQARAQYEYYAEKADISYEQMLSELGTSEEKMLEEARRMAIDDLLFELVRRAENITLEEGEKLELFDRYVKKYVDSYGYDEEYVRENLSDEVYDSMLYDKVSEFLIASNQIIE